MTKVSLDLVPNESTVTFMNNNKFHRVSLQTNGLPLISVTSTRLTIKLQTIDILY